MAECTARRRGDWLTFWLLLICLTNSGCLLCAAGAAGAGTYAYCKGKHEETYAGDFGAVWQATHVALNDLGMPLLTETRDAGSGTIDTETGTRQKVWVSVTSQPGKIPTDPPQTKVAVRVATFGDEQVSRRVLQQVQTALGAVSVTGSSIPK